MEDCSAQSSRVRRWRFQIPPSRQVDLLESGDLLAQRKAGFHLLAAGWIELEPGDVEPPIAFGLGRARALATSAALANEAQTPFEADAPPACQVTRHRFGQPGGVVLRCLVGGDALQPLIEGEGVHCEGADV